MYELDLDLKSFQIGYITMHKSEKINKSKPIYWQLPEPCEIEKRQVETEFRCLSAFGLSTKIKLKS